MPWGEVSTFVKWGDDSLRDKGLCGFDELILIQHWGPARSTVENGCSTMGEGEGRGRGREGRWNISPANLKLSPAPTLGHGSHGLDLSQAGFFGRLL